MEQRGNICHFASCAELIKVDGVKRCSLILIVVRGIFQRQFPAQVRARRRLIDAVAGGIAERERERERGEGCREIASEAGKLLRDDMLMRPG